MIELSYAKWLDGHLKAAKVHYTQLCKLDDEEQVKGGSSEYYEQAHQMFGYIAALETCLKELKPVRAKAAPKAKAKAKKKAPAKKAKR